ncbi:MAG: DUF1178 family protein [Sphingomonas sp.]|uniref:DUF1178 family protein n=1 Tax=Sphingomonas sp. Leaf208 TaxID=1735679 RepID=UPI0006F6217C|nr:DUF1178 family protein [Sphingomonas sp. Leaf208]KQM46627.1 hypothetical protein ASE69_15735 [Sphingomonas sp. Leaf208]RZM34824.1 MAG: DUF1178 family protein [Sphingomonas sp.]
MIVFDLKCGGGHVFEAWFGSSGAYEEQRSAGHVRCPVCDDGTIAKAVMAPAISAKSNSKAAPPTPDAVKVAMKMLATRQAKALESSEWVGTAFADRARAMHLGDEKQATIHGQASLAEAKALVDEGVPVAPLPLPIVPPGKVN